MKKKEYERIVKMALYYKYCFILSAMGKMKKDEIEQRLYRCSLSMDTIKENEVKALAMRLRGKK